MGFERFFRSAILGALLLSQNALNPAKSFFELVDVVIDE
jgi:hypothetical protein